MKYIKKLSKKTILAILAIIVIGVPLLYLTVLNQREAKASWMDENWLYRIPVPISAHTAAESNVFITVTLDTATPITAGKMQSDCGDLRFTQENGEQLPYFINASPGCNNAATTIQVNFKSFPAGAQTIYYYYGNASAPNGFNSAAFSTAATGATIGSLGSETQGPGPVGYWKFDDGQGTNTQDSSPNNNDGTITGATWQTEDQCVSGKCLFFDGSSDYISVSDGSSLDFGTGDFAMFAWIKGSDWNSGDQHKTIFCKENPENSTEWCLQALDDSGGAGNVLNFRTGGSNIANSSTQLSNNTWYYVGVVRSGTSVQLYINGLPNGSAGSSSASLTNALALNIGYRNSGYNSFFNGFIDEPKIYPYARTQAQILTDFNSRSSQIGTSVQIGPQNQWLSQGLVGYWKMDEASWDTTAGQVLDASGNSNNGTSAGNATTAAGKFGNGGTFDGTGDYVDAGNGSSLNFTTGDFSVSVWVKPTSLIDGGGIFGKNSGGGQKQHRIRLSGTSGNIELVTSDGTTHRIYTSTTNPLSAGAWTHLVGIRRSNSVELYANGILLGSTSGAAVDVSNSANFIIGSFSGVSFDGSIDDTRVYNRALSPKEVSDLYNWAPGPVGYWDFEEGNGGNVNDKSGYGNNGAWSGTGTKHWDTGKYGKAGNFNGTDDKVTITRTSSLNVANQVTVDGWVKRNAAADYGGFFYHIAGYASDNRILVSSSGTILTQITIGGSQPGFSSLGTVPVGQWTHIAYTYDGANQRLYINGKLDNTLATTGAISSGSTNEVIGNGQDPYWLTGQVDDVKVYNYARSAKQIVQDMQGNSPVVSSKTPLAYWKFDEGQGITANNSGSGGAGLNGTISNGTWSMSGKFDKALTFGATTSVTSTITDPGYSNAISLWINPTTSAASKTLVTATKFTTDSSSRPVYGSCTGSALSLSTWTHILAVSDGSGSCKIYQNGVQTSSSTTGVTFGTSVNIGASSFTGTIDEVKVYNYALTADEVKLDYNHGSSMVLGANSTGPSSSASDTFTRSNGALGNAESGQAWTFNSGVWTVSSNKATGSPTLGSELVTNGNMETGGSPVSGWTDFTSTSTQVADERTGGSGSNSMNMAASAGGAFTYEQITQAAGTWIQVDGWAKNIDASYGKIVLAQTDSTTIVATGNLTSSSWAESTIVGRLPVANFWAMVQHWAGSGTKNMRFDDMSAKALTLSSLFASVSTSVSDITISADATVTSKTQGGVVLNLDSATSPANFVIAYHDGTNAHLDKAVAGTYTSLINTAATYSAGATIKVIKNGTQYSLYYNGTQVGTTQTISDSGIISNTKHGLFSTYSANTFDNFTLQSNGSNYEYCIPGDTSSCGAPVGKWDFEEGSGTSTLDISGNGYTGTITGATWKVGKVGKALNFDGTDDSVTASNNANLDIGTDFTVEAWVYPRSSPANGWIIGKTEDANNSWLLYQHINDGFIMQTKVAGTFSTRYVDSSPNVNQWYHLAGIYDSSTGLSHLYVNGVGISSVLASEYVGQASGTNLFMGARDGSGLFFNGQIDNVRIFNYVRTAAQVAYDYNRGGPVGWWKFDECQGATAHDSSGNNNSGTITIGASGEDTLGTCTTSSTAWGSGATGKRNASLNLDGTDDYAQVADSSSLVFTSGLTVSAWVKPNAASIAGATKQIVFKGNNSWEWGLGLLSGKVYLSPYNNVAPTYSLGTASGNTTLSADTWYHVSGSFDGNVIKVYVNGVLDGSTNASGTIWDSDYPVRIGSHNPETGGSNPDRLFGGPIDDVRVYNYALTAAQVKDVMNNGAVNFGPVTGSP